MLPPENPLQHLVFPQYEEDRLLGGGSRRVPGLRTRLELNWQKEREEQQRLIQETATLAKDLRQVSRAGGFVLS